MLLAFAEVSVPAEAAVLGSGPCPLAGVGRRRLLACKFLLNLGFLREQEMRLDAGSGPSPKFLRHPDCSPGLRFPGGRGESWLWSLGIGPGEVSGRYGFCAVLQRAPGQIPRYSKFGSLEQFLAAYFFPPFQPTFLPVFPRPPSPPLLHHFPLLPQPRTPTQLFPLSLNSLLGPSGLWVGSRGCHSLSSLFFGLCFG